MKYGFYELSLNISHFSVQSYKLIYFKRDNGPAINYVAEIKKAGNLPRLKKTR